MRLCGRIFKKMPPTPFCTHPAQKSCTRVSPFSKLSFQILFGIVYFRTIFRKDNLLSKRRRILTNQTMHYYNFTLKLSKVSLSWDVSASNCLQPVCFPLHPRLLLLPPCPLSPSVENYLLSITSDVWTLGEKTIWVNCWCWGNWGMVEGRFSKWF